MLTGAQVSVPSPFPLVEVQPGHQHCSELPLWFQCKLRLGTTQVEGFAEKGNRTTEIVREGRGKRLGDIPEAGGEGTKTIKEDPCGLGNG